MRKGEFAYNVIPGAEYGLWTVLSVRNSEGKCLCKCVCGAERYVRVYHLATGQSKACSNVCRLKQKRLLHKVTLGAKYGHWTVTEITESGYAICRCQCGYKRQQVPSQLLAMQPNACCRTCADSVLSDTLLSAREKKYRLELEAQLTAGTFSGDFEVVARHPKSDRAAICKCINCQRWFAFTLAQLRLEPQCKVCNAIAEHVAKLVPSHKLLYWLNRLVSWVFTRCDWQSGRTYIHSPWLQQPELFAAYLVTLPGCNDRNLTLDRIDNTKGYEPNNLRFVTKAEQAYNKRTNIVSRYPSICNKDI